MKFFSFDKIRDAGDCTAYVQQVLGLDIKNGRCQATWRGGDGYNIAVTRDTWYDHVAKHGGGIIELAAHAKHNGDIQQAQQALGEWLGLAPDRETVRSIGGTSRRYDELISEGYTETTRYKYEDEHGELIHFVARLEHPERGKEFLQGTPKGWGLRDTNPILYRLKDWIASPRVCIVEGEKDADTLLALGIPATTNCGGAEKWRPEYAAQFKGKSVAIIRDNDEAGQKHAERVSGELRDSATQIRVVCPSALPKGDVTDWIQREGGTKAALQKMIAAAVPLNREDITAPDPITAAAKSANERDICNYSERKEQVGAQIKVIKTPRQILDICEDIHRRFCGFPRRIRGSDSAFDHDRSTGEIVEIYDPSQFFAWMGRKSRRKIIWAQGEGMVTKGEIFKCVTDEATTYEAVSQVPDWPRRLDVYYAHPALPKPSPDHAVFEGLVDFFAPASPGYKTLLKAFVCAPIWYCHKIQRPGWIIDSQDGAGVGKTTLVEMVATLYRGNPIRTNRQDLKHKHDELVKRIVSSKGRQERILLVDNVVGTFHSAELADLMTSMAVSGRSAYGRGEESRPNNLTYAITSNSASVDNDLADRCYFVMVKRPSWRATWKQDLLSYIERHRMQIFADIIDMLNTADPLEYDPQTRFPEFECAILRGVCDSQQEYDAAMVALNESKQASNVEEENARTIEDEFSSRLIEANRRPGTEMIFIRSDVATKWLNEFMQDIPNPMQYVRNLAKNNLTQRFAAAPDRYPHHGNLRRRGIMWIPENPDGGEARIIGIKNSKTVEII